MKAPYLDFEHEYPSVFTQSEKSSTDQLFMSPFAILDFKIPYDEIEEYYRNLKELQAKETVNWFDEFAEPPIPN